MIIEFNFMILSASVFLLRASVYYHFPVFDVQMDIVNMK